MKWTRPLERFLEMVVALWMFDVFFHRAGNPPLRQEDPSQREWARPGVKARGASTRRANIGRTAQLSRAVALPSIDPPINRPS
jgi:hypothetical protein